MWEDILKASSKISYNDRKRILKLLIDTGTEWDSTEIMDKLKLSKGSIGSITRFLREGGQRILNHKKNDLTGRIVEGTKRKKGYNKARPIPTFRVIQ